VGNGPEVTLLVEEEEMANSHVQGCVAEKFKSLVVPAAVHPFKGEGAVDQGELKQLAVAEDMAYTLLKQIELLCMSDGQLFKRGSHIPLSEKFRAGRFSSCQNPPG
jgi:hypothetical protein